MLAWPRLWPPNPPGQGLSPTMDVTCERCRTEYELDDALVSSQGTTVKCTSCGLEFKVYRGDADGAQERWIVRQGSGRELVFLTLRELQRAIEQGRITREDLLSRGSVPARPLGSIAELAPFFRSDPAPVTRPQHSTSKTTLTGIAPVKSQPLPEARPAPILEPSPAVGEGGADGHRSRITPPTPMPREPVSQDLTPSDVLPRYGLDSETYSELVFPRRSNRPRTLRFIVAFVVVGMLGVAGATVGRKTLEDFVGKAVPATSDDARLRDLLAEGERALARGDIESAKEAFDKASVLDEHNPQLVQDLSRLASVRADSSWLKLRLVPSEEKAVLAAAQRALDDAVERAKRAVDKLAAGDPKAIRAKIDVLRMQGDLPGARALVEKLSSLTAQPETAYVLAMLDVADEAKTWTTIVERLRTAAADEQDLSRARAVLVYALARSGDLAAAKSELAKILALPHPHPLSAELQAYVSRLEGQPHRAPTGVDAGAREDARDAEPRPSPEPAAPALAEPTKGGAAAAMPTNHHELLKQASRAKSSGELDRAEQLYGEALARHPGDTEALGGLGDIARARGDIATARRRYEQAYEQNPSYLPVMSALADLRLAAGDRTGAASLYRDIIDTAPGTQLATRAREKLAQMERGATKPGPAAEETAPASTKPELPPEIDTSDLPGFQR